jgi:hypothetical protein
MIPQIRRLWVEEKGQDIAEYAECQPSKNGDKGRGHAGTLPFVLPNRITPTLRMCAPASIWALRIICQEMGQRPGTAACTK